MVDCFAVISKWPAHLCRLIPVLISSADELLPVWGIEGRQDVVWTCRWETIYRSIIIPHRLTLSLPELIIASFWFRAFLNFFFLNGLECFSFFQENPKCYWFEFPGMWSGRVPVAWCSAAGAYSVPRSTTWVCCCHRHQGGLFLKNWKQIQDLKYALFLKRSLLINGKYKQKK